MKPGFTDIPHARNTDPQTSHAAAKSVDVSAQAQRVLEAYQAGAELLDHEAYRLVGFPPGRTSHQRCSDLRELGYIARTGARRMTPSGKAGYVCRVTRAGLDFLARIKGTESFKGDGKMADEQTATKEQPTLKVKTMLPDSQFLICGQSATRKTSTASFFPKPMLVSMWDSKGQAVPYFKNRKVKNLEYDEQGTPYHEVVSPKNGQLLIRVEYYNDPDPVKPNALQRWIERMNRLRGESNKWRTYVLDSVTGMHHNAQIYMRRVVNKDTEVAVDKRMYWNINDSSGMFLREQLYSRIPAMPCNVVIIAHIKEAYAAGKVALDRKVMRIAAPGEISWELASQYPEVWFSYMEWDPNAGENVFYVRTEGEVDDGLAAKSQFGIKGPVEVGRGGIHRGYLAMCEAENSVGENWVFN